MRRFRKRNRGMAKSEAITACMPSWPEIPTPMSAVWIMLTSFAPSPEVIHTVSLIITIIIITIAFKGAFRDFWHSFTAPWTRMLKWPRPNCVQITCNTMSAYHMHMCHMDSSAIKLKSHLFYLYFIGWTINWWRKGGNRSTQRKPLVTRFGSFVTTMLIFTELVSTYYQGGGIAPWGTS